MAKIKTAELLGPKSMFGGRTAGGPDWRSLVWIDRDHTPYNKRWVDGTCTATFEVGVHMANVEQHELSADANVSFKMEERVEYASGKLSTRVVSFSIPRDKAEAIARFILTGKTTE